MSRWTPNKPIEQVMQVNMPFSRKDGHRVGNGKAAANAARAAEAGAKEALEECKKVAKDERESFHRDEKTLVERLESLLDFRETGLRRLCRVTLAVHAVLALAGLVFLVVMVLLTP